MKSYRAAILRLSLSGTIRMLFAMGSGGDSSEAGQQIQVFRTEIKKALRIHIKDIRFVHKMYGRFQSFDFTGLTGFYRFFQKGMTGFRAP